ncbi:hypothetical protein Vretimale_10067 [Volvox reticuliferus]|uniref:Uncharacterized protein n=1 Tax=Volvox reticuliferus TaxID=1737510 RepID=A0A8J4BUQ8_9CHLO|nr:hypothetical protein Vretifemale_765 [Volvox reticuliferus]GIM05617.1 hypothetical protein Vretimale_10067 [Volvox reticuliferus]
MRGQVSQVFSRQTTDEAWSRGSRCTCRARRYIPPRKQVNNSLDGSSSSRRKQSTSRDYAPPDQDDLLRELNGGSVGWLRDEEEQDWGLDDVAEHARARRQQQLQRFGGGPSVTNGAPASGANGRDRRSGSGGDGGAGGTGRRRRDGRRRSIDSAISHETFGSPLESGLASISSEEGKENEKEMISSNNNRDRVTGETQDVKSTGAAAAAAAAPDAATSGGGHARGPLAGMSPGAACMSTSTRIPKSSKKPRKGRTTVEMELSYARRNPEVVEALRLRGFAVRVRQSDGITGEEMDNGADDEAADSGQHPGLDRDHLDSDSDIDGFGLSDEDDGLDLDLDLDLTAAQELGDQAPGGVQGRKIGRSGDARNGQTVQSGSRADWYDSLAAAGFSVRSNAAGEVFLERTVRRKNLAPAPAAPATTTATTAPLSEVKEPIAAAGAKAAESPTLSVPPLEPLSGRPVIVKALQRLTTPQQVLDFLELSYSQWAANGYRLADKQSGKPVSSLIPSAVAFILTRSVTAPVPLLCSLHGPRQVAGPSPAEAAHCLRALATTARRTGTGGWRCLELAAGRQVRNNPR